MPRNGTGNYTLPAAVNPVITQTLITSNWANTTMNDLAAAITQSLSADGQTVPTANLPMGGFHHTGVGDPSLRDNYASLGFVQDGSHLRLTNVAGVNQITATLIGGAIAATNGQIVQLIPVANNTGAVTLNINGTGFKPVKTDVGNDLAAGNLIAGRAYLLSYDGAVWAIISANSGVTGFMQAAMSGWDRPTPAGPYPLITQVNATTVAVPGGKGRIVRPSARDLSGVTEVEWAAQNVVITNVAVSWTTYLGVNAAGAIVQFTGNFSPAWARDNILIGSVAHINGQINEINTIPAIFGDMVYASYDIAALLNNTLAFGGRVFPNAVSPFHIDLEAGAIFSLGGDSADINGPNTASFPAAFDLSFFPVTGASVAGAATQNVPVTQYDPGGTGVITPIPGGASTTSIHRLFLLAGEFVFLYGQATYADLTTALSQISVDDAAVIFPAKLVNATLLCYIVAQKDCTDLKVSTKARIVAKGGANFGLGSAGSITDAPINGLTYGRKDATWVETIPAPVGPQATLRQIRYYTNTFTRFSLGLNDTPEGGANSGSDIDARTYSDAGGLTGTAFTINRATRLVTFNEALTANQNFNSSTLHAVLASSGAGGNCYLRPNGPASVVNQLHVQTSGNVVGAGSFTGLNVFAATSTQVILAATGAGNVFLRPNGSANVTGQTAIGTLGNMTVAGNVTSTTGNFEAQGVAAVLGTGAAGSVFLRPNGIGNVAGQFSLNANGQGTFNMTGDGVVSAVSSTGYAGFGLRSATNQFSYLFFQNVTNGECARLTGSAAKLTVGIGNAAASVLDVTLSGIDIYGRLSVTGSVGFYGTAPVAKPTITGARGGNAALTSLLAELAAMGLINNGTSA